jgi:hypothetical protein
LPVGAATTNCDAAGCGVAVAVEGVVEGVIDSEVTVAAAD